MAMLDDVKVILESGHDPSHKLDLLATLLYPSVPDEPAPAPKPASKSKAPKVEVVTEPEPLPDAA